MQIETKVNSILDLPVAEIEELQGYLTGQEKLYLDALLSEDFLSLADYIRAAWHILEPATPFVDGWHIDATAEHLEAVSAGWIRNLIINIPPGTSKSLNVCVFWPTWEWTFIPHRRFLTASHSQPLATRDALRSRRLIQSPWYQARWGHKFSLTGDQNQKMRYDNNCMGFRLATSVGGGATGERGDVKILDDPHKADEVLSDTQRMNDIDWVKTVWSTRQNDPKRSADVVVMQRLHEKDTSGYLLEEVGDYEHLMLPMRFEPERKCFTSIGFEDPRTEHGELLCPERFDEEVVVRLEKTLGSYGAAGQLQQRPAPEGGGIFKNTWWRFWVPQGYEHLPPVLVKLQDGSIFTCPQETLPDFFTELLQSWDPAQKDTAAYVVGQVWARLGANKYLLDQVRKRMGLPATIRAVRELTDAWPEAHKKLIEDKANGPAIIQTLRDEIPGLIAVDPQGDKVARARAVSPTIESGNVYLPHPSIAPWVEKLITEATTFPNGTFKDQVDTMTQALIRMMADEKRQGQPQPRSYSMRSYR